MSVGFRRLPSQCVNYDAGGHGLRVDIQMSEDDLIAAAVRVLKPYRREAGRLFGDAGAAVLSEKGNLYTGTCIDTAGGFCAERSAMAAMITDGEYKIQKVVAVWRDERNGELHILPPCGICREFMRNVDEEKLERSGCSWKKEDSQAQRASAIFRVAGSIGRLKATSSVTRRHRP